MTNLNWNRKKQTSTLNSEYWADPKNGFDKSWHTQNNHLKQLLGTHSSHEWEAVKSQSGPHSGKLICKTCNNKFICWLPKNYFNT